MRHRHAQNGELVRFPRQRRARGHHIGQLGDVGGHLVSAAPLDLAVVLPGGRRGGRVTARAAGREP